jgi:hypothetical protein
MLNEEERNSNYEALRTAERNYFQEWGRLGLIVKYQRQDTDEEEVEWISECYAHLENILLPAALHELYPKHLDEAITAAVNDGRDPVRGDVQAAMASFLKDASVRYEMTETDILDKLGPEWNQAIQSMTDPEVPDKLDP